MPTPNQIRKGNRQVALSIVRAHGRETGRYLDYTCQDAREILDDWTRTNPRSPASRWYRHCDEGSQWEIFCRELRRWQDLFLA